MGTDLLPFDEVAALIACASALGILLLTPLYLSQRRDVQRLREWMMGNPEHATKDLALSESRLDKTEVELERIYAERGEAVPGTAEQPVTEVQPAAVSAAARVTSERPALERITMERAALEPHQQLRRFGSWFTQPRYLAALAVGAFVIAAGAIIVVQQGLLEDDGNGGTAATVDRAGIEVAVLNTTSADGLAGRTSRDIEQAGYLPGDVESFVRDTNQTVVMYQRGEEKAAKRVARDLGDPQPVVQKIDREVQDTVPTADVVVILGQDRVSE
jgi:LytR cell envelope-related transcriptional attenuator